MSPEELAKYLDVIGKTLEPGFQATVQYVVNKAIVNLVVMLLFSSVSVIGFVVSLLVPHFNENIECIGGDDYNAYPIAWGWLRICTGTLAFVAVIVLLVCVPTEVIRLLSPEVEAVRYIISVVR